MDEMTDVLAVVLNVLLHFCVLGEQLSGFWPWEVGESHQSAGDVGF